MKKELSFALSFRQDYLMYVRIGPWAMFLREPHILDTTFTLPRTFCSQILSVLRLGPIYALLGSQYEDELGDDFKTEKFVGEERAFACEAASRYRELLDLMVEQDIART